MKNRSQLVRAISILTAVALCAPTSVFAQETSGRAPDPSEIALEPDGEPESSPSLWAEHWPVFSMWEGIFTAVAGVGAIALFLRGPVEEPRWTGGILFDDAVRDGIRASDEGTRDTLRTVGDITYYATPLMPFVVDSLIVSLLIRGDGKLAGNLAAVGLESFAYSGFLSFVSTSLTARDRPYVTQCLADNPGNEDACPLGGRTESFWSGHTTISATAAGLVCASHIYMPLWGHPVADGVACGFSIATALTTGLTRVIADRHYATDVVLGTGIGFGIGYAVPMLLHYRGGRRLPAMVAPVVTAEQTGVNVSGTW